MSAALAPEITGRKSEGLLTRKEAAARMGVSERTLERMDAAGNGPGFVRISVRAVRYSPAAVDALIASRAFRHRAEELSRNPETTGGA